MSEREIPYEDLRECLRRAYIQVEDKDAEIKRLRARITELEENIRSAGDFVEEN